MKNFEQKLTRLEELSEKLKEGKSSLEDAVIQFDEGIKLAKELEKELAKIERKIEILVNNPISTTNEPELALFPEIPEEGIPEKGSQ